MPFYSWKGIDHHGKTIKGLTQAEDQSALKEALFAKQIALLEEHQASSTQLTISSLLPTTVSSAQRADFFENLSLLLNNGVHLTTALTVLQELSASRRMQKTIQHLIRELSGGQSLDKAMQGFPEIFSPFIIQLISVGQQSGRLGQILETLSQALKRQMALQQQLRQAALMPLITLSISLILTGSILFFVMPHFEALYRSLNTPLPHATRTVLAISRFIHSWWGLASLAIILAGLRALVLLGKATRVRKQLGIITLYLPIVAPIIIAAELIMFMQTITTFLAAGLPLAQALKQAEQSAQNYLFQQEIAKITAHILEGHTLSDTLASSNHLFFDPQLIALVRVGENTGLLGPVLENARTIYEKKLSKSLHTLTTIFSPLLMVFIGVGIGGMMITMYLPIFSLGNLFGQ